MLFKYGISHMLHLKKILLVPSLGFNITYKKFHKSQIFHKTSYLIQDVQY